MVIVKATKNSEAGIMPSEKLPAEMGQFNEQLVHPELRAREKRLVTEMERQRKG